jgi:hypothetical protein
MLGSDIKDIYTRLDHDIYNASTNAHDAFSRLRVSNPYTVFDSDFCSGDNNSFTTTITGTASTEFLQAESTIKMNVSATQNSSCKRDSFRYMNYSPGKSHFVLLTFVFGQPATGIIKRVGYYDDGDGYYLELNGTDIYIVERSSVTGQVVENKVHINNPLKSTDGV